VPAKLKVFRTAVGFRDAYVAAPSKAAALRAWGTDKDLFARGGAELVTDEALMQEALSKPGEVVYRTRGGLEEQIAALGTLPKRDAQQREAEPPPKPSPKPSPKRKPKPRPSRAKLEAAEQAIAELEHEREEADAAMRERERALAAERAAMEARFAEQAERLKGAEHKAREAYQAALRKWEP
jgi:hypothetical protein